MVNINMPIPEELHKKAKISATIDGKSLKDFLIEILEDRVKKENKK